MRGRAGHELEDVVGDAGETCARGLKGGDSEGEQKGEEQREIHDVSFYDVLVQGVLEE